MSAAALVTRVRDGVREVLVVERDGLLRLPTGDEVAALGVEAQEAAVLLGRPLLEADGEQPGRWITLTPQDGLPGDDDPLYVALLRHYGLTERTRVVAYVTRGQELLVFDHRDLPDVATQVPAGGAGEGEPLEEAAVREVLEETGLAGAQVLRKLGVYDYVYAGFTHHSHYFHLAAPDGAPDAWEHVVTGGGGDHGLVYACRFVPTGSVDLSAGAQDVFLAELR